MTEHSFIDASAYSSRSITHTTLKKASSKRNVNEGVLIAK